MYFDAVLDENLEPIFNGTPEEVKTWLRAHREEISPRSQVCVGESLLLVSLEVYEVHAL